MPGVPDTVIDALVSAGTYLTLADIRSRIVEYQGISETEARKITGASLLAALEADPRVESRIVQMEDPGEGSARGRGRQSKLSRSVKTFAWCAPTGESVALGVEDVQHDTEETSDESRAGLDLRSDSPLYDLVAFIADNHGAGERLEFETVATILDGATDKQIGQAAETLRDTVSSDAPLLLLATPRRSKAIEKSVLTWGKSDGSEDALAGVLGWLIASKTSLKQVTFAADYLENVEGTWSSQVASVCLDGLTHAAGEKRRALLRIIGQTDYAGLQQAAEDVDLADLRRSLQSEAMSPGRRRVLWAMMQVSPDAVDAREAWIRASLDDLVEMAASPRERALLTRQWVHENVVTPLVRKDLESADRFALSRALGYPTVIFNAVGAQQLAQSFASAAKGDPLIGDAVKILGQAPEIQRLSREVDSARQSLSHMQAQVAALQARLDESDASTLAWKARALQAEREQVEAGTHEIRQAHVDGMKALAEGLAAVDRLGKNATVEAVLSRLLTTASQHGLSPIGSVGGLVTFDPSRHHALTDVSAGQVVRIHERGFLLNEASGQTVLVRATVSAGSDE